MFIYYLLLLSPVKAQLDDPFAYPLTGIEDVFKMSYLYSNTVKLNLMAMVGSP